MGDAAKHHRAEVPEDETYEDTVAALRDLQAEERDLRSALGLGR